MSGAIGMITGFGRMVVIGGQENLEVIQQEIAPGLFRYPNGDPRRDATWLEDHRARQAFKDDFRQADEALGFHTHHGGSAFISLATYLAWPLGREFQRDLRVSLCGENYKRHRAQYALGIQAIADTLVLVETRKIDVSGLMSVKRMELLRAVIAGEVVDEVVDFDEDSAIYELEASGFAVERKQLDPGQRIEYRALNPTRLVIVAGGTVWEVEYGAVRGRR